MNAVFWGLQILLALHTLVGAGWKAVNSEAAVPTLSALPHGIWTVLIPLEVICAAALVLPALAPSLGWTVPLAAIAISVEMAAFALLHLRAGGAPGGPVHYWLGVAAVCAMIAAGRLLVAPL